MRTDGSGELGVQLLGAVPDHDGHPTEGYPGEDERCEWPLVAGSPSPIAHWPLTAKSPSTLDHERQLGDRNHFGTASLLSDRSVLELEEQNFQLEVKDPPPWHFRSAARG